MATEARCAGWFRPGDKACRRCGEDKPSHQVAHRGAAVEARAVRCRCGNEKPLRQSRCESCEYERHLEAEMYPYWEWC